jgi:hypothetical protein
VGSGECSSSKWRRKAKVAVAKTNQAGVWECVKR